MSAGKLRIALIQPNIVWENTEANILKYNSIIDSIPQSDIVVMPEMFTTGFSMNIEKSGESVNGTSIKWMQNASNKYNTAVVGSIPVIDNGIAYNRLYMVNGNMQEYYNKRHLFKPGNEHNYYQRGEERKVFNIKGYRILPQICYDLRFPVWSRNRGDYDIIINVANWPAARTEVWRTLLKARAIENQCYVIGVNRVGTDGNNTSYLGSSMVVDARGEVLLDLGSDENYGTIELSLEKLTAFRRTFPVLDDGDDFLLK